MRRTGVPNPEVTMKVVLMAGLFAGSLFIHGCAAHRALPSADHIVGLSPSELRACAGAPTDEGSMGTHALWTYVRKVREFPALSMRRPTWCTGVKRKSPLTKTTFRRSCSAPIRSTAFVRLFSRPVQRAADNHAPEGYSSVCLSLVSHYLGDIYDFLIRAFCRVDNPARWK